MQAEILRPAEYAEKALLDEILNKRLGPGDNLPAERELSARLGVARPALREALQRLARDGWVVIQHGKPTRVTDYWREGGLNVLSALVRQRFELPEDFIPNLLEVRLALAPAYTWSAVRRSPMEVVRLLADSPSEQMSAEDFAAFDWQLHYTLTIASGNPIYTLILNGFASFYTEMAQRYFINPPSRQASAVFYAELRQAALNGDALAAEQITRMAMVEALKLWGEFAM